MPQPTSPRSLCVNNLLPPLQDYLDRLLNLQILDRSHPNFGALINPDYGIADPKMTELLIVAGGYLELLTGEHTPKRVERMMWAAEALLHLQRPSGLIDLLSVNYDSSPDTGFTVQQLCPIIELGRSLATENPQWATLLTSLETFVRCAVPGILSGGFHTPNHRWVMVSAVVQAKVLFSDLEVKEGVEAYLAEGFDIDGEGAFIERSVGVYDAVNTRSLLLIAEYWPDAAIKAAAIEAVARNLNFDLHLLHADGTAETGLSRRQDYGTREVALGLIPSLLLFNRHQSNPTFVNAAQRLWEAGREQSKDFFAHLLWISHALIQCRDPIPSGDPLPNDFAQHYPINGIWRVRRQYMSASAFQDVTRLFTCTQGQAELSSLKISQTYFGQYIGRFVGNTLQVHEIDRASHALLRSEGLSNARRPAYELPRGKPVPPEQWTEMLSERSLRWLKPLTAELNISEVNDGEQLGFDFHYRTLAGLDGVTGQIAFDFAPGGIWETADTRSKPSAGQVIFLKQGSGAMRYGSDVIRIGPGMDAHATWQMRDAETAPDSVRVLITFRLPVDFRFHLRVGRGV